MPQSRPEEYMSRPAFRSLILLAFAVLLSSAVALGQARPGSTTPSRISGEIRLLPSGARAPQGIVIQLEGDVAYLTQVETDNLGKFVFDRLIPSRYVVRIRYPGYQEQREFVDLTMNHNAFLRFDLKPNESAQKPPAVPPEGPAAAVNAMPESLKSKLIEGRQMIARKEVEAGLAVMREALKENPNSVEGRIIMGTTYMDIGQWENAEKELKQAIALEDKMPGAHLALGVAYNNWAAASPNPAQHYRKAQESLVRATELAPDAPEAHVELAQAYFGLTQYKDSEKHSRKAISLNKEFAPAYAVLGNSLLRERKPQEALEQYRQFLARVPSGPLSDQIRGTVQRVEQHLRAGGK
jgi:tetratricopeptide (TPR) repeat protein